MSSRLDLHNELLAIPGIKKVYFQPPSNTSIQYPCIIYELNRIDLRKADNKNYLKFKNYTITVVTPDPDDTTVDYLLDKFTKIRFDRTFKSDNLYHNILSLYY